MGCIREGYRLEYMGLSARVQGGVCGMCRGAVQGGVWGGVLGNNKSKSNTNNNNNNTINTNSVETPIRRLAIRI